MSWPRVVSAYSWLHLLGGGEGLSLEVPQVGDLLAKLSSLQQLLLALGTQTNSTSLVSMAFTPEPREHSANLSLEMQTMLSLKTTAYVHSFLAAHR